MDFPPNLNGNKTSNKYSKPHSLDLIDLRIISTLCNDSNTPFVEIARNKIKPTKAKTLIVILLHFFIFLPPCCLWNSLLYFPYYKSLLGTENTKAEHINSSSFDSSAIFLAYILFPPLINVWVYQGELFSSMKNMTKSFLKSSKIIFINHWFIK